MTFCVIIINVEFTQQLIKQWQQYSWESVVRLQPFFRYLWGSNTN